MEIILVFLAFLALIAISLNGISGNNKWAQILNGKWIALIIIVWAFFGFLQGMHFSTFFDLYSGPESAMDEKWRVKNLILTIIPIVAYSIFFLSDKKPLRHLAVILEMAIYFFIYIVLKGDYTWGFMPVGYYIAYDFIAVFLRIFLLLKIFEAKRDVINLSWFLSFAMVHLKQVEILRGCFG